MALDFEIILALATVLSGIIWLVDAALFARRRRQRSLEQTGGRRGDTIASPTVVEYARSFFPVLLIVLLLRSFIAEPFRIPSPSMLPTLEIGDFILVSKYSYGLRLPITHDKIVAIDEPERGDVVVFRYPRKPSVNYIKRIVGVPGDQVAYYNRRLFINGDPVPVEKLGMYHPAEEPNGGDGLLEFVEKMQGAPHSVLLDPDGRSPEGEFIVPEGRYFVMGDNRDHSNDSRIWGYVPERNLVGKAQFVWMHWDWNTGEINWSRIGHGID